MFLYIYLFLIFTINMYYYNTQYLKKMRFKKMRFLLMTNKKKYIIYIILYIYIYL